MKCQICSCNRIRTWASNGVEAFTVINDTILKYARTSVLKVQYVTQISVIPSIERFGIYWISKGETKSLSEKEKGVRFGHLRSTEIIQTKKIG